MLSLTEENVVDWRSVGRSVYENTIASITGGSDVQQTGWYRNSFRNRLQHWSSSGKHCNVVKELLHTSDRDQTRRESDNLSLCSTFIILFPFQDPMPQTRYACLCQTLQLRRLRSASRPSIHWHSIHSLLSQQSSFKSSPMEFFLQYSSSIRSPHCSRSRFLTLHSFTDQFKISRISSNCSKACFSTVSVITFPLVSILILFRQL